MKPRLDPRTRRIVLFAALALTLLATRWVDGEPDVGAAGAAPPVAAEPGSTPHARQADRPQPVAPALDLGRLKGRGGKASTDAFAAKSWDAPPPSAASRRRPEQEAEVLVPPPPPQAPPLPFRYVGMLGEDDAVTVFLAVGERDLAARVGETIDGSYRLESADGRNLVFTYLPLGQQQTLFIATP